MSDFRRKSTVNNSNSSRTSIRQNVFLSTLTLVIASLALTGVVYVFVFFDTSSNLIEGQSKEINKQIVFNYEQYITDVIEIADYLHLAVSTLSVDTRSDELESIFFLNNEIKDDIVSIFLFHASGRRLVGDRARPVPNATEREWFVDARSRPEIYHFTLDRSMNSAVDRNEFVISVSREVSYLAGDELERGVLLVELNTEAIVDLSEQTNLGDFGHILIIDDQDELVYASSAGTYAEASFPIAAQTYLGGFPVRVNDLDMYLNTNVLAHTRWRIVTLSNIDEVNTSIRRVIFVVALVGALSLAVTALVAALISVRISRPIDQLKDIMARIEAGDLHTTIEVSGQKEIVQLSKSFNRMVVRIRELMNRLVDEQREKRKTALRALQNQINPHFLYNTLDSIVWLAEHERGADVVTTVVALATLFRISISKGNTFISVGEEIDHIKSYLTIQKIRYLDKFEYSIDIEPDIEGYRVMKLMLQPLVENAIYHGMGDETGWIAIRGRLDGDRVVFEVENSGYGLTDAQIVEMHESMAGTRNGAGVGLRNVYQRLTLYYGEGADIEIESRLDESTTIRLVIPASVKHELGQGV